MLKVTKHGMLLEPTERKFENYGVLNPACIEVDGIIHLLYRATNIANYSTVGYCQLNTPTTILNRHKKPFLVPKEKYESQGIEDPRIVKINDTFYITYTAYDGHNALGALVTSKDMITFERQGIITPKITYREYELCIESCDVLSDKYLRFVKMFYERGGVAAGKKMFMWDKDVVMFPRKINGKFAFLHRLYPDIQIAYFNEPEDLSYQYWKEYLINLKDYIVLEGKFPFEASYVGGGCPPIETPDGWLMIYHGVQDTPFGYVYHAAAALLDLNDPTIEIGRLDKPLFSPEVSWEKHGVVNNVVFPTGAIVQGDILYIYYGAADKQIGVASVSLNALINEIKIKS